MYICIYIYIPVFYLYICSKVFASKAKSSTAKEEKTTYDLAGMPKKRSKAKKKKKQIDFKKKM